MTDPHGNNPEEDPEEHIGEPVPDPWDEGDAIDARLAQERHGIVAPGRMETPDPWGGTSNGGGEFRWLG
jgi:hypothetical protein